MLEWIIDQDKKHMTNAMTLYIVDYTEYGENKWFIVVADCEDVAIQRAKQQADIDEELGEIIDAHPLTEIDGYKINIEKIGGEKHE